MQILLALALCLPCSANTDDVAALRAEGPPALARLLERYRSLPEGPAKVALETEIDAVAAQRYATVSGLYWYTDMAQAEAAAHASAKPILSLRMLGRLDEELSCANSRFFRVALYANGEVAQFLRDNFVLHWSSERPVPKVTIDFGDGRTMHTTLAGNSAHYLLDADGRVIDVLPGLYSPVAFRRELEQLLPLARRSPALGDQARSAQVREFQRAHDAGLEVSWSALGGQPTGSAPGIVPAEARAFGKSAAELPLLAATGLDALVGGSPAPGSDPRADGARLDASSRALLERLLPADERELARANFERALAIDTQRNELGLRRLIHGFFAESAQLPEFESLNARIYREVFLTPAEDSWLGLRTPGVFNGLPNGGLER